MLQFGDDILAAGSLIVRLIAGDTTAEDKAAKAVGDLPDGPGGVDVQANFGAAKPWAGDSSEEDALRGNVGNCAPAPRTKGSDMLGSALMLDWYSA
mmetsp:Transcript_129955/g.277533  ORF Transcript_129955/g.277533 Transcript_129955/m.277533 type:complete len:96 (+) Transcript_129955:296-583(+)